MQIRIPLFFWTLLLAVAPLQAEKAGNTEKPSAPQRPRATVYSVNPPDGRAGRPLSEPVAAAVVERLVIAVTGKPTAAEAWKSLVTPKDRVGIKVSAAGSPILATHVPLVEAVLRGLESAGIPRNAVWVWDRDRERLEAAGFKQRPGGYRVGSVPPFTGYDRKTFVTAPVIGKLVWGDVLFDRTLPKGLPGEVPLGDELSSNSHLAEVLARRVDKVINMPVLCEESSCGIAGALYNMTVPNLDNWRRFVQPDGSGAESIAWAYSQPALGPKVVLHIMDCWTAQFAGGPQGDPHYLAQPGCIRASLDPVALDSLAFRQIEEWRVPAKLPPLGRRGEWLQTAQSSGLGVADPERIDLLTLSP
jgi:hypothetical protein